MLSTIHEADTSWYGKGGRGFKSRRRYYHEFLFRFWVNANLMALIKIVSGGQTGVDRGALDAALAAGFPCGGWCPADRRAEDGPIPQRYPLTPLPGAGYRQRTQQNLIDSDGTAILFYESVRGGTKLTRDSCVREKKPFVVLDAKLIARFLVMDPPGFG